MRLLSGRARAAGLVAVAVGLTAAGISYAAIPDSQQVIHGCYAKSNGALRVIDPGANQTCDTKKENPLPWNQRGPSGPTGADGVDGTNGATGPTGDRGPTGLAGSSGTGYQTTPTFGVNVTTQLPTYTTIASIRLPAGKWAVYTRANAHLSDGLDNGSLVQAEVFCRTQSDLVDLAVPVGLSLDGGVRSIDWHTPISLQDFVTSDGTTTMSLECTQLNNGANATIPTSVSLQRAFFIAVPVGDYQTAPSN
jgi:hypothetical protein